MKKSIFIFCLFSLLYFGIPVALTFADDYTPVNHPPVALDISLSTEKNVPVTFSLVATDEDADALTFTLSNPGIGKALLMSSNEGVYTPTDNYVGTDRFDYQVTDGYTSVVASITVTIIDSIIVEPCVEDDSGQLDIVGSIGVPGGIVKIPVKIQKAANSVSSFGFEIVFDPEMLTYKSFSRGALVENFDYFEARLISDGIIRCGGAKNNGIMSGASGSVVFIEFEIIQTDPATQLSIQNIKDDFSGWTISGGCFQGGCNGDINADGEITPMDALNSFEKYLGICPTSSNIACEDVCGDVNKDGDTTPADTLCIFQNYLGLPNCLDDRSAMPEAVASAYPPSGKVPLTVMFAAQYDISTDGNRLKYEWDFQGDGQFDVEGSEVSFTYSQKGTYTAILRVTDQDGLTATDEITIVVEAGDTIEKVITIIASPPEGKAPLDVFFIADDHDNKIMLEDVNNTSSGQYDSFFRPKPHTIFDWYFDGDNNVDARGREAFWTFKDKGEYLVKVKATYEDGSVATGETMIYVDEESEYIPDSLYIVARPCIGPAPLQTKMYVTGRFAYTFLENAAIEWDFDGDGQSDANSREVEHTFTLEGEYEVNVTVSNGTETMTSSKTIIVKPEIIEEPKELSILAVPNNGIAPLDVQFSLVRNKLYSTESNECRIQWDFESDGTIDATGFYVTHVYQSVGEYVASCQLTDFNGNIIKGETIITVLPQDNTSSTTDPL